MLNYQHVSDVWVRAANDMAFPPRGMMLNWWPKFSRFVGGLRPNELTLLCAPTGAGKTQFLANLAAQAVTQGESVFAAPVETGDTDFVARMISGLERFDFNNGDAVNPTRLQTVSEKYAQLVFQKRLYLASYDNRVEVEEMITMLKYMHSEYGVSLAILDNLNFFLKVTSSQMEKAEMDNTIHEFVILAKKIPLHIVLVVHPRKTQDGRVESEFDIKGSSTAVQEASNVILFNRPKQAEVEEGKRRLTDRELVFRKIRKRGVNVGQPIWFGFENGRYREMEDQS